MKPRVRAFRALLWYGTLLYKTCITVCVYVLGGLGSFLFGVFNFSFALLLYGTIIKLYAVT